MANNFFAMFLVCAIFLHPSLPSKAETEGEICSSAVCAYELVVRWERTMTYRSANGSTYNVALEGRHLKIQGNPHKAGDDPLIGAVVPPSRVITADGFPRNVITVNRQFPGPTIRVMQGVKVRVRVVNLLWTDSLTIHWHGLSMENNLWMDGVPYLTQCPIPPGQAFVYTFRADTPGTHWYHSHLHSQHIDGLQGMFVVYPERPSLREHFISIMDWMHVDATTLYTINPYNRDAPGTGEVYVQASQRWRHVDGVEASALAYTSALVNGRGRRSHSEELPLEHFVLEEGRLNRFRLIHSGAEFAMEISIDNHLLSVVALDGMEIKPVSVHSLVIFPGETMDFTVKASEKASSYYLRGTLLVAPEVFLPHSTELRAVVIYKSVFDNTSYHQIEPTNSPHDCSSEAPCTVFGCPFLKYISDTKLCVNYNDIHDANVTTISQTYGLDDKKVEEIFLNAAFSVGSSINGRRFVSPTQPLYQDFQKGIVPCQPESCQRGCSCTHIIELPLNRTVQVILSTLQVENPDVAHHSMHLHGSNFAVVHVGFPYSNSTNGKWQRPNDDILCDDSICTKLHWNPKKSRPRMNLKDPSIRDTVVVPAQGYVVLRFRTDNPGVWLLHCHQELHNLEGMAVAFRVGADSSWPPRPEDFPTCYPYEPSLQVDESADVDKTLLSVLVRYLSVVGVVILGLVVLSVVGLCQKRRATKYSGYRSVSTEMSDTTRSGEEDYRNHCNGSSSTIFPGSRKNNIHGVPPEISRKTQCRRRSRSKTL